MLIFFIPLYKPFRCFYYKTMKKIIYITLIAFALLVTVFPVSPAVGKSLLTEGARISDVTGNFTVMLYGGRYSRDIETVAFLIPEGSKYTFELYAPDFDYRVVKGLEAKDAINTAEQFVRIHNAFLRSELSKILDVDGKVIGFELRPLYYPLEFGIEDVIDTSYALSNGRVRIYVTLKPEVMRRIFGSGGGSNNGDH